MRDVLTSTLRRVQPGLLWPLVLLALPTCSRQPVFVGDNLKPGPMPHGDAVMCDIEKYQGAQRRCATAGDVSNGIPLTFAAIALVTGQQKKIGLDYSSAARAHCGPGNPEAIDFQDMYPDGLGVCINCAAAIPALETDATAVCVAECQDITPPNGEGPAPPDPKAFCAANAHPSTNFPLTGCFNGACSAAGTFPAVGFADPRRNPEPVIWDDPINTNPSGNSLTKNAGMNTAFDAGAVSDQWVKQGDTFVEAEATENTLSHVFGFQHIDPNCAYPCTDSNPDTTDIDFAISLDLNRSYYVLEGGAVQNNGVAYGMYGAGQRFRVTVKNKPDGTFDVAYSYLVGVCNPGNPCSENVFYTHTNATVKYPLRVDTSFRELNATLKNVTIVRIQPR